jgi:hypothetical protein
MKKALLLTGLAAAVACGSSAGDMLGDAFDDMTDVPDADAQSPGDGSSMQYVGNSDKTFSTSRIKTDPDNGNTLTDEWNNEEIDGIFEYYAACQETFGPGARTCTADEIRYTTKIPNLDGPAMYGIDARCSQSQQKRNIVKPDGTFGTAYCCRGDNSAMLPVACCGPR